MPDAVVCPQCARKLEGSLAQCPGCGAILDGVTTKYQAVTAETLANTATATPRYGMPVPAAIEGRATESSADASPPSAMRDGFEHTIGFGTPGPTIARRSASSLRLQTLMSHETIAAAVKRLRERMRDRPNGLKSIVDLAVLVTLADNEIDEIELVALHETVGVVVGDIQTGLARHLINVCVASIRESGLEACAESVRESLAAADSVEDGLVVAFAAAYLSGGLSIPERGAIQAIWEGTSVQHERVAELRELVLAAVNAVEHPAG